MKIAIALLALLLTPCLSLPAAADDMEAIPPSPAATSEKGAVGADSKPTGTPKQETSETTPKEPCWLEEAFPYAKKLTPAERIAFCDPVCREQGICRAAGIVALVYYLVLMLLARFFWVVEPNNARLRSRGRMIRSRVACQGLKHRDPERESAITDLLEYVCGSKDKRGIIPADGEGFRFRWVFAFTGRQLAAWRTLHEAERHLDADEPYALKMARGQAIVALSRLVEIPNAPMKLRLELQRLSSTEAECPPAGGEPASVYHARRILPLLQEAKALIYAYDDGQFEMMADAKNKGYWLVWAAFASVIAIGALFPGAVILLLAGAIGGLLARLRKAIKQKSAAFDFGVSWGVMFLTPLVGAITGWLGVAMVQILLAWEFFGEQLLPLQLYEPNLYTAVLAFLFGLSATLFDKFVERFESSLAPDERNRRTSGELEALAAQDESDERRDRQERDVEKQVEDERDAQPTERARSGEGAGESPGSPERGAKGPKKTDSPPRAEVSVGAMELDRRETP